MEMMFSAATIGSFVINAGHLELTISRVIEWMNGNPTPGAVGSEVRRLNWNQLLTRLKSDAATSPIGADVARLLEEHRVDDCMSLRHSLVHGSVDITQPPAVVIVRRYRDDRGDVLQLGSRAELEVIGTHVVELSRGLDGLLPEEYRRSAPRQDASA